MENHTTQHTQGEHTHHKTKKSIKVNAWMAFAVIFFITTAALGCLIFTQNKKFGTILKPNDVATKAVKFVNDNFDPTKKSTLNKIYDNLFVLYKMDINYNGQVVPAYVSADGKLFFAAEPMEMTDESESENSSTAPSGTIVDGNFTQVTDANICKENDKPVVYFFGSTGCPHCVWEKPIIKEVAQLFGDSISYHENIDSSADQDIFTKYNPSGGIPTIIIGCKYYRVGSGEQSGEATEKANLTKLICDATGNQASVCQ